MAENFNEELNNIIILSDEDGNQVRFEFIDLIEYEGEEYVILLPTDEDGDEVVLYPARLDLLVYGRKDADAAQQAVDDWTVRQAETYDISDTSRQTCNGQDYTISTYSCKSETNPYDRGISAFGAYKDYAVSAELNCLNSFTEDEAAILTDFLRLCHYAA